MMPTWGTLTRTAEAPLKGPRGGPAILHAAQGGTKEGHGKSVRYLALFSEIGLILFVTTLGGALAGWWVDEQLGTYPLLLIGGFIVGVIVGALADWRLVTRFLEDLNER